MHILFLTDNFPPEVNAPAARTFEHARRWVTAGAKVTIITGAPNFPTGKVYPGYRNRWFSKETLDGIEVRRVWTYMTANEGFARRVLDYVSFAVTAFLAGLFVKADIIVATSPQFFTACAGAALSTVRRRPWIFEVRDLWPESLAAVGATRNRRLLHLLERLELALYSHANHIIVVSPAFTDNLVRRGIAPGKISVITNGADLSLWRPRVRDAAWRAALGAQDAFLFGYVGTHGMAHGLDFILRALASRPMPQVQFVFVGDGAERAALVALAAELALTNIHFLPAVPKEDAPAVLANCDAALVPLRRSETFRSVIPSKIFEAAAMGRPILLGVEGQAADIVRTHAAGLCFEPENSADFLSAVERMASDAPAYAAWQAGCANLAAAYDRDTLAAAMLGVIRGTLAARK